MFNYSPSIHPSLIVYFAMQDIIDKKILEDIEAGKYDKVLLDINTISTEYK